MDLVRAIGDGLLKNVDSLGLNEQELSILARAADGPTSSCSVHVDPSICCIS